jgi:hypothetical protein
VLAVGRLVCDVDEGGVVAVAAIRFVATAAAQVELVVAFEAE